MKNVSIIMSTYNGEKFIEEQIKSILEQRNVKIKIYIRDDGSTDRTIDILNDYCNNNNNIYLLKGSNVGVTKSFYLLSEFVNKNEFESEYYAFADQDDVWEYNKLQKAINKLEYMDNEKPNLYYSNLLLVDRNMNKLGPLYNGNIIKNTKEQALAQIFTLGCTCVFNKAALEEFSKIDKNSKIFHDNWIFMICMFLGNVYYDKNSYIKYRQHGDNTSGSRKSGIKLFLFRAKKLINIRSMDRPFEDISKKLLEMYYNRLLPEDREMIELIANYRSDYRLKLKLLFNKKIIAGYISKDLCVKLRVIINKT